MTGLEVVVELVSAVIGFGQIYVIVQTVDVFAVTHHFIWVFILWCYFTSYRTQIDSIILTKGGNHRNLFHFT
jgi:hypothetical protein